MCRLLGVCQHVLPQVKQFEWRRSRVTPSEPTCPVGSISSAGSVGSVGSVLVRPDASFRSVIVFTFTAFVSTLVTESRVVCSEASGRPDGQTVGFTQYCEKAPVFITETKKMIKTWLSCFNSSDYGLFKATFWTVVQDENTKMLKHFSRWSIYCLLYLIKLIKSSLSWITELINKQLFYV